jgi:hypothetical protein
LTFRGAWTDRVAYAVNDAVGHQGAAWIALRPNRATEPTTGHPAEWMRLAAKGDAGERGPKGEAGPPGPPGPAGVTTIIGGGMGTGGALSTTTSTYLGLFVASAYFTGSPVEAAQVLPVGGTLSAFHVRLRSEASAGLGTYTFTLLRDATGTGDSFSPTSLSCTVSGAALGCSDTGHSETFKAGDLVVVRATPAGPVFSVQMQWTARFAPSP